MTQFPNVLTRQNRPGISRPIEALQVPSSTPVHHSSLQAIYEERFCRREKSYYRQFPPQRSWLQRMWVKSSTMLIILIHWSRPRCSTEPSTHVIWSHCERDTWVRSGHHPRQRAHCMENTSESCGRGRWWRKMVPDTGFDSWRNKKGDDILGWNNITSKFCSARGSQLLTGIQIWERRADSLNANSRPNGNAMDVDGRWKVE